MTAHPRGARKKNVPNNRLRVRMPMRIFVAEVRKKSKRATKLREVYVEARTIRSARRALSGEGWEVLQINSLLRSWHKRDRHHRSAEASLLSAITSMPFDFLLQRLVQVAHAHGTRAARHIGK